MVPPCPPRVRNLGLPVFPFFSSDLQISVHAVGQVVPSGQMRPRGSIQSAQDRTSHRRPHVPTAAHCTATATRARTSSSQSPTVRHGFPSLSPQPSRGAWRATAVDRWSARSGFVWLCMSYCVSVSVCLYCPCVSCLRVSVYVCFCVSVSQCLCGCVSVLLCRCVCVHTCV